VTQCQVKVILFEVIVVQRHSTRYNFTTGLNYTCMDFKDSKIIQCLYNDYTKLFFKTMTFHAASKLRINATH